MGKESFALLIHGTQPNPFRSKSAYQVAKMVEKYLKRKWADDIQARGGDAPKAYGKKRWAEIGLGGGDGAGIIWEGFYEWTTPVEMFFIERLVRRESSTLKVFRAEEWMIEIF